MPGTPSIPSADLLRDGRRHNETTVPPDLPESSEPTHPSSLDSTEEATTTNLRPQAGHAQTVPPDPAFPALDPGAIHEANFEPAESSFRGWVQQPEGKPSGAGSYSDVFRCPIQFVAPSKGHPTEVIMVYHANTSICAEKLVIVCTRWL